ncbi:FAD-dependent oxidoreductase [Vreelandella venusta]|uniref:FAD-dependent oxidoreductase n=1 Tax=Vreelandella venusta TaxID=44935 RepID=UPI003556887A
MRPTLHDCVPVIGPSRYDSRVIYAFGHKHLGITLAGTTGELVAACVRGQAPEWLNDYSAARFSINPFYNQEPPGASMSIQRHHTSPA